MADKNWRKTVAWCEVVGLLSSLPLVGGEVGNDRQVVGLVIQSSAAALGGAAIPGAGAVFSGNLLTTAKGGNALVKFSATTQASLQGESSVIFRTKSGGLSAQLLSGTVVAETAGSDSIVVNTSHYDAEPAGRGRADYAVRVFPDQSILVAARQGKILIKDLTSGKNYLVPQGSTAVSGGDSSTALSQKEKEEAKQLPSTPAGPSTEGEPPEGPAQKSTAKPQGQSHTMLIVVGVAAAAGIGAAVAAAGGGGGGAAVSPSHP
jgi:hypothetical protein